MICSSSNYLITFVSIKYLFHFPPVDCHFGFSVVPIWTLKVVVNCHIELPVVKCQAVDCSLFTSLRECDKLAYFVLVGRLQFMLKQTSKQVRLGMLLIKRGMYLSLR